MMEKMPSSVSMGRRWGEMIWMPEKARALRGTEVELMARALRDGEEERFLASLEMTVFLLSMRRPRRWRWSSKRRGREGSRDWMANVARAGFSGWNWGIAWKSMLVI